MSEMTHPAKKLFVLAALLLLLAVVLSFISVFVPWAMKDIAPGNRLWAYPFKHCIEYTFSTLNAEYCQDNDFSAADNVSGGNTTCRTFIVATIVFVFIMVIIGVVTLILLGLLLWRFMGKALGILIQLGLFVVFAASLLSWVMWIVYTTKTCVPNSPLFPLGGYSYGFILQIFATFLSFLAVTMGYLALSRLYRFEPMPKNPTEVPMVEYPYSMYLDVQQTPELAPTPIPHWSAGLVAPAAGDSPQPWYAGAQ